MDDLIPGEKDTQAADHGGKVFELVQAVGKTFRLVCGKKERQKDQQCTEDIRDGVDTVGNDKCGAHQPALALFCRSQSRIEQCREKEPALFFVCFTYVVVNVWKQQA